MIRKNIGVAFIRGVGDIWNREARIALVWGLIGVAVCNILDKWW